MSYKKNMNANRDALFGGGGGGGGSGSGGYKKNANANRDALFSGGGGGSTSKSSSTGGGGASSSRPGSSGFGSGGIGASKGYSYGGKNSAAAKKKKAAMLSADAKAAKKAEAEDYRKKANKCMQQGLFKRADPIMASNFYKRAADAYDLCGEYRLARLHRVSSADSHMTVAAYATAAQEYVLAAESVLESDEESLEKRREEAAGYHKKAADAYKAMNENAKAAKCMIDSALVLLLEDDSPALSRQISSSLEESVEAHVPDVLNHNARYRQTGVSAFIDPDNDNETVSNPSQQSLDMAHNHLISKAYAHEPLMEVVYLFVRYGEYASALYAAGAVTTLLSKENMSTLSLSRSYCIETILTLAMGDPIAAEQNFLSKHCQNSQYLTSRECKLSEDLFRAIKQRDIEELEEARSPSGSNRAALANLNETMRELVTMLRLSGVARPGPLETSTTKKKKPAATSAATSSAGGGKSLDEIAAEKTGYEKYATEEAQGAQMDTEGLMAELDELNFGSDEEELDDDDVDLR